MPAKKPQDAPPPEASEGTISLEDYVRDLHTKIGEQQMLIEMFAKQIKQLSEETT